MRKKQPKFQAARKKILQRDDYACRFCHFRSPENEIINLDHNYRNNKADNLATACHLCAQCNLLDFYQIGYEGKDQMIFLPEMQQEQVNQLCRLLFCRIKGEGEMAYNAQMVYAQLQDRVQKLEQVSGAKLNHPGVFLYYLHSNNADHSLISAIRWLPSLEHFEAHIPHWTERLADELS